MGRVAAGIRSGRCGSPQRSRASAALEPLWRTDLARHGRLPDELAAHLAPAAALGNRLVHQYAAIDDRKLFAAVVSATNLFPRYVAAVRSSLP